jgi:hypothetical protein
MVDKRSRDDSRGLPEQSEGMLGRRTFLKYAGFTLAGFVVPDWLSACGPTSGGGVAQTALSKSLDVMIDEKAWIVVVRPLDLLRLRFNFINLSPIPGDGGTRQLALIDSSTPGLILVEFPPQHIVEPTQNEPLSGTPTQTLAVPLDARISGVTRLAFVVPTTVSGIPYDLPDLLQQISALDLNVAVNAAKAADDALVPPAPLGGLQSGDPDQAQSSLQSVGRLRGVADVLSDAPPTFDAGPPPVSPVVPVPESQTAIELPYRLQLSPSATLRFAHSPTPYAPAGSQYTELWTSRLARANNGVADEVSMRAPISVRAIAAPDLVLAGDGGADTVSDDPFPGAMALEGVRRAALVQQTSDFNAVKLTAPIHAKRLALSARGGSLDAYADFGDSPPFSLVNWQHRASFGRDNYVRVEVGGFLFPFQHRATVVTISERKFLPNAGNGAGPRTAFLWKRSFIVVRQPLLDYTSTFDFGSFEGKAWPFRQIRILTPSTPPLDAAPDPLSPFFPTIGGTAFRFAAQFVDLEGNVVHSNIAALWVPDTTDHSQTTLTALQTQFAQSQDAASANDEPRQRSQAKFRRQRIAYAPTSTPQGGGDPKNLGKTTHETQFIQFKAGIVQAPVVQDAGVQDSGPILTTVIGIVEAPQNPKFAPTKMLDSVTQTISVGGTGGSDFFPLIDQATLNIASARQFTGDDASVIMKYADTYLQSGFGAGNTGEAFMALAAGTPLGVNFGSQSNRSGGFMSPSQSIIGLSRQAGPIAGNVAGAADTIGTAATQIQKFAQNGNADPNVIFSALSGVKLFGCFPLTDIFGGLLNLKNLPKFASQGLDIVSTAVQTISQIQTELQNLQKLGQNLPSAPDWLNTLGGLLGSDPTSGFIGHVTNFFTQVTSLPPGQTFLQDTLSALSDVSKDIASLRDVIKQARSLNASRVPGNVLPSNLRLNDGDFAKVDGFLKNASSMIPQFDFDLSDPTTAIQKALLILPQDLGAALQGLVAAAQMIQNQTARFEWHTDAGLIQAIPKSGPFVNIFWPSPGPSTKFPKAPPPTVLALVGEVRLHEVAGKPAGLDLSATLNNFDVNLLGQGNVPTPNNPAGVSGNNFGFISLSFDHLTFSITSGGKPDIDVKFSGITFEGDLKFLNQLKSIIPLDGFGDPPGITCDASGIKGDFTLALPSLAVGVMAIENMSLGAQFQIPFIGPPMTVGFHFCERDNPFHLTVCFLGGGGYFLMDLSLKGIVLVEAAFEFGAEASVDFVVASGSIYIFAGIYFQYAAGQGVTLTGYVRMGGSLSVLGLISASIEMRLDLSYMSGPPSRAEGTASITIEVSILFFSTSVDIKCTKTFGACNNDPTFAEVMGIGTPLNGGTGSPWDEYVHAFAA